MTRITNNQFETVTGIATYGDEYNKITNNGFLVQSSSSPVKGLTSYGSNAFLTKSNTFTESTLDGVNTAMVYLSNTGIGANELKLNEIEFIGFNDDARGIVAAQNNSGLKIRCNDITFHPIGIGATKVYSGNLDIYGPIAELQGLCGSNQSPANNYFADDCDFTSNTGIHIFTNPGVPLFTYNYLDNGSRFVPDTACIANQNSFDLVGCQLNGPSTNYCPDIYGKVSISSGWVPNRPIIDTLRWVILSEIGKVDGGNTPGLIGFVNGGSATNVLDSLYEKKLLSDDVLLALIHRTPLLNADSLAHILVNTAPQSSLLLMSLAERTVPIPTDSLEKIYLYQDSISARKPIIDSVSYFRNELELAYNGLLFIADEDGYDNYPLDSIIALLEEETDVNLQLKLADLYMANGQYTDALSVLNDVPVYYNEVAQHITLREMQLDMLDNGLDIEDLNGDELGNLATLAASNTKAAWQAKAILIALGIDTLPSEIEERIYSSPKTKTGFESLVKPQDDNNTGTWLKLYPNPANNTVTLKYYLHEEELGFRLELFDLFGKTVKTYNLGNAQGEILMDISDLSNGIYLCNLSTKGKKLWQEKLVIVR